MGLRSQAIRQFFSARNMVFVEARALVADAYAFPRFHDQRYWALHSARFGVI